MFGFSNRTIGVLTFLACASVFVSAQPSSAQIAAGATIPLDISQPRTAEQITQTLNTCLLQETLFSLLGLSPNSTLLSEVHANVDGDEVGTQTAWTKTAVWFPYATHTMSFDEWTTPSTSETRELALSLDTEMSYTNSDFQVVTASFNGNPKGKSVSVELTLDIAFPHYQIESIGGSDCTVNEWGRNGCKAIDEKIASANLVIPQGFVNTTYWTNSYTGHATLKMFDTYKYAECLMNGW